MITLGKTYKDMVTGLEGVATGLCQFLTGVDQVQLCPKIREDGGPQVEVWLDQIRCEEMDVSKIKIGTKLH